MTFTRRLALAVLTVGLALGAAAPAGALTIGVADQQPDMFRDARFLALGLHSARLSFAWDALLDGRRARPVDRWLRAARAAGVTPLISFDRAASGGHQHRLPTVAQYARQFRAFRARYPWVRDFATWNEANYCGEPTCHAPGLVAAYYRALRRICPSCHVLAAELLDDPGMVGWVRNYERALGARAPLWGLHNYLGANRLQTRSTLALLHATRGQIWFTEVGGLVARHPPRRAGFPQSPAHAAVVTRFLFETLARLSPRITRVYLYQWNASPRRHDVWDSALVGPEPGYRPRPAFAVFVHELARLRAGAP